MTGPAVLIVVDDMNAGGMERQVLELLKGLRSLDAGCASLAVLKPGGQLLSEALEIAPDAAVFRFGRRPSALAIPGRLAAMARGRGARVVCCFGLVSGLMGLAAGRLSRLPVVNASVRSAPLALSRKDRISRFLMRRADLVVANSRAGLAAFGLEGRPDTVVIRNGVDPGRFSGIPVPPEPRWDVCMVGNFWANKDQATLLEAFALVLGERPGARLVLVGRDWGTLEPLRRLAARLSVDGRTDFVTDSTDPLRLIASSRVCCLLSPDGEGISNALLEYMALGRPVVATRCPGNEETVSEGVSALLVDNDPEEVAGALLRLLGDPALCAGMGAAGLGRVMEHFSLDSMVERFRVCLESVPGRGGAGGCP
jgi:glycosyltransferase involved in cell wall biosynthesis